jgi:hypothetical protein
MPSSVNLSSMLADRDLAPITICNFKLELIYLSPVRLTTLFAPALSTLECRGSN